MEAIKEKKFTPGPWQIDTISDCASDMLCFITDRHDVQIALIKEIHSEKANANAKLIASAPDLLEALLAIIDAQDDPEKSLANLNQAIESSRQVIQKATS